MIFFLEFGPFSYDGKIIKIEDVDNSRVCFRIGQKLFQEEYLKWSQFPKLKTIQTDNENVCVNAVRHFSM